jgi:hypothetical protein
MKYIPLKLVPGEVGLTLLHMSTCVYLGIVLPLWANRSLLHALLPWVVRHPSPSLKPLGARPPARPGARRP